MTKVPPANFSPELVALMNSALDTAVHRIDRSHRTPATKAKMAQRIVRTASEGDHRLARADECCGGRGACASGVTTRAGPAQRAMTLVALGIPTLLLLAGQRRRPLTQGT